MMTSHSIWEPLLFYGIYLSMVCSPILPLSQPLDDNKKKIISGGGVPLLIDLIRTGDSKLQNEAVGCLRNLSMDGN